jgi:hypothetical protein
MKIYISYRRSDSQDFTGRIYDRLVAHFGFGSIFIDVDSIPIGKEFQQVIREEIAQCDVLIAVIGQTWSKAADSHGRVRLREPQDFVRIEIEEAFKLGKPVIPLLVGDASMPGPDELPHSIWELNYRHAARVRSGPDFHSDLDRLIQSVEHLVSRIQETRPIPKSKQAAELDLSDLQIQRVFVSHSTLDRQWVEREIISFLDENGIRTWYAKSAIITSAQWEREILRGMESCDWFLLVVSPRAAGSEWVKDELCWAIDQRPTKIIPVIQERTDLYQFHIRLPRLQHVDFSSKIAEAKELLLHLLRKEKVPEAHSPVGTDKDRHKVPKPWWKFW